MGEKTLKVDGYLHRAKAWKDEMAALRTLLLETELEEDIKWAKPCYTLNGANVILILAFKETCALLVTKGALLDDPEGILIQPTENTQSARQIRFTSVAQISQMKGILKKYIQQAIEVEKSGKEVVLKKVEEWDVPEEFQSKLNEMPDLKAAFDALTPGRRRQYLMHFSQPKQAKTREARVEKCAELIFAGKGLNDG